METQELGEQVNPQFIHMHIGYICSRTGISEDVTLMDLFLPCISSYHVWRVIGDLDLKQTIKQPGKSLAGSNFIVSSTWQVHHHASSETCECNEKRKEKEKKGNKRECEKCDCNER